MAARACASVTEEGETTAVLHVRRAREDDASEVAGVHVRSWQVGYRGLLPSEYLDGLRAEDRMYHYTFGSTDPTDPTTMVAVEAGVICGFVTTGATRDPHAGRGEVFALYVDPEAWGTGVGRCLMAEARRRLARGGATEAVLWVLAGNDRAQRFYAVDGWAADGGHRNVEVWNVAVDEIRYRRQLP